MKFEFYEETNFKETEIGPLPVDWEVVRLGEVVNTDRRKRNILEVINGVPFIPMNLIPDEGLYIKNYEFRNLDDVRSGIVVYEGELLLAKITPSFENGKQGILKSVPFAIATTEVIPIKTKDNICDVEFLFYNLKLPGVRNQLAQRMEGTTGRKRLSKNVLYNFLLPLPPLEEQKAIAEVLRAVQEVIEKTNKVIRATKELKKSMMRHLFTYGPVSLDKVDGVELKETEIGLIPKHWEVVRLGEVAKFSRGLSWKKEEEVHSSSGRLVLSIPNIANDGKIIFTSKYNHYVKVPIPESKRVKAGEILLVGSSGSLKNVGRCAYVELLPNEEIGFASFVFKASPNENVIDNRFLFFFFNSHLIDFAKFTKRASDGKYNLQLKDFQNNCLLPLPPLEEQKQIAQILQAIDQKIEKEENYKKALKNLFKSLLHSLMSGKIRVRNYQDEIL